MQTLEAEGLTALLMAFISAEREHKGIKRCRNLVKGARLALGMETGAIPIAPSAPKRLATDLLRSYCWRCGRCEMGKRP